MNVFKRIIAVIVTLITMYTPAGTPENPQISVMLAGDVLILSDVANALDRGGTDALISPGLADLFREADISMVNLEMAASTLGAPVEGKTYTFRGKPPHLGFFTEMGVDVVSIANNHTLDYGRDAFLDTLKNLTAAGIGYAGGGENLDEAAAPWITEIQGQRIGVLCATRVVPTESWHAKANSPGLLTTYDPARLNEAVRQAKETCDFVLVYVHWGVEHNKMAEEFQRKMARGYIDAGADAVIGSHPHILQGFEIYNGKPIAYSLGNFIFSSSKPNPNTCAVRLNLTDEEVWMEVLPCQIKQPKVSLTEGEQQISERLRTLEEISFGIKFDSGGRMYAAD